MRNQLATVRTSNIVTFILLLGSKLTFGQSIEYTFNNPKDSTVDCYIAYIPKAQPKGLLLLLPGFGETTFSASQETTLPQVANDNNLLTVIASLQDGRETFYVDSISQQHLDKLIFEIQKKYKLQGKTFYLGGFSLGGSGVVKYAERTYSSTTLVKPNAIFAIDPPLDFERFYKSLNHAIQFSKSEVALTEAKYFTERIAKEFNSTTQRNINVFYVISPYSYSDTLQTEIKKIITCPIRLITEPDINWQISERNRDYHDMNAIDCSSAINSLKLLGNTNAELVTTTEKGYRQMTRKRNPHSWSIAESTNTVKWLIQY